MTTAWIVLATEDNSFIAFCKDEETALQRAINYETEHGDECDVYEEELEG